MEIRVYQAVVSSQAVVDALEVLGVLDDPGYVVFDNLMQTEGYPEPDLLWAEPGDCTYFNQHGTLIFICKEEKAKKEEKVLVVMSGIGVERVIQALDAASALINLSPTE